jgi:hypothetical protein
MNLDRLMAEAEEIRRAADAKLAELVAAIKQQEATQPGGSHPGPEVKRLTAELRAINARLGRVGKRMQDAVGVTEDELEAIERAALPPYDERWWRHQIVETPPSEYLDDYTPKALRALLDRVDPDWLRDQAARPYRLDDAFLSMPLHIVAGVRMPTAGTPPPPQRFAHMLLVAIDHLEKRDDLDFFSAAAFVPELTALGCRLDLVPSLGPEAVRKLERLPVATDEEVPSMIYELLVGTACVLKGRDIEMLPTSSTGKSPDFRLHNMHAPAALECKRRQGLTRYELDEAAAVERLYKPVREAAKAEGLHGALEVRFRVPVERVNPDDFVRIVTPALDQTADAEGIVAEWGELSYRRLPFNGNTSDTRLYSPDYLQEVFGWSPLDNDWDGLLCDVEQPVRVRVNSYRLPFCMKWRSDSPEALTKKARGVTSLWASAAKQIPAGEVGFIYIAYPEGQRGEVADARTRHIVATSLELWHRWSIRIPVTVIGRLYARALGVGVPDLIESALPGVSPGEEHWLAQLPGRVFSCSRGPQR